MGKERPGTEKEGRWIEGEDGYILQCQKGSTPLRE